MFQIVKECSEYFLLILFELLWTGRFNCLFSGLFEVGLRLLDHFFEWLDLLEEFRVWLFDNFLNDSGLNFFFFGLTANSTDKIASKKFDDCEGKVFCALSRKVASHLNDNNK